MNFFNKILCNLDIHKKIINSDSAIHLAKEWCDLNIIDDNIEYESLFGIEYYEYLYGSVRVIFEFKDKKNKFSKTIIEIELDIYNGSVIRFKRTKKYES